MSQFFFLDPIFLPCSQVPLPILPIFHCFSIYLYYPLSCSSLCFLHSAFILLPFLYLLLLLHYSSVFNPFVLLSHTYTSNRPFLMCFTYHYDIFPFFLPYSSLPCLLFLYQPLPPHHHGSFLSFTISFPLFSLPTTIYTTPFTHPFLALHPPFSSWAPSSKDYSLKGSRVDFILYF
jgi:hypothetical protein